MQIRIFNEKTIIRQESVKHVTRHNKDITTDEKLKLINKSTFIPFKVIILVTIIKELGDKKM